MIAHIPLSVEDIVWAAVCATAFTILLLDHPWQRTREEVSERKHAGADDPTRTAAVVCVSPNGPEPDTAVTRHSFRSLTSLRAGEREGPSRVVKTVEGLPRETIYRSRDGGWAA